MITISTQIAFLLLAFHRAESMDNSCALHDNPTIVVSMICIWFREKSIPKYATLAFQNTKSPKHYETIFYEDLNPEHLVQETSMYRR